MQGEAQRLLSAGVTGGVFPGASACIAWSENGQHVFATATAGKLFPSGPSVTDATTYDLASLTKPFVAVEALKLVADDKLELDMRADSLVSDVRGTHGGSQTVESLFTHTSGLAPWGGLYLDVPHDRGTSAARRWILSEAARRAEERKPETDLYSDLGYMIAGEVVARAAGVSLDRALRRDLLDPLGIADSVFYAGALPPEKRQAFIENTAPTERCEWRGQIVRGEVHDENCAALGGVSGHAGLFGTAAGVARFAMEILDVLAGRSTFLPKAALEQAIAERPGFRYRFGWDGRAKEGSASGRQMGPRTFGHLGFTGTSVWCDPDRDVAVILLTNRVHPSRANEKIKGFRPAFHDGVIAAFDS